MSNVEFYRCELCGNMVALIKKGGGELVCCGQPMTKLSANSTDAAQEKHVPDVAESEDKIKVTVGSTIHPMTEEHYIEWIALAADDKVEIKYLKPGDKPVVEFDEVKSGCVYAYCNLHGLWKTELDYVIPNEAACSPEFPAGCVFV
jgi:superoxide reductase